MAICIQGDLYHIVAYFGRTGLFVPSLLIYSRRRYLHTLFKTSLLDEFEVSATKYVAVAFAAKRNYIFKTTSQSYIIDIQLGILC